MARDDIVRSLADWAELLFFETIDDLLSGSESMHRVTVILHLAGLTDDEALRGWERSVRRLVSEVPFAPIVIYGRLTPATAQQILVAGRAGVGVLSLREINNLSAVVRASSSSSSFEQVLSEITDLLGPLAGSAQEIVEVCVRNVLSGATGVSDLARVLEVSTRTIANRLHVAHLASPERVISQCRVLVGIRLMQPPLSYSASTAARALGFGSVSEFRGMVKRVTGLAPTEILDCGGFAAIAHVLRGVPVDVAGAEPGGPFRLSDRPFPLTDYPATLEASA